MFSSRGLAARKYSEAAPKKAAKKLVVEGLEQRQVLAGNVLATLVGGNLMIQGDSADNGLAITMNADGSALISGVEAGRSATTINGSTEPFEVPSLGRLTRINLRAGDDQLTINTEVSNTEVSAPEEADTIQTGANFDSDIEMMNSRLGRLSVLRNIGDRLIGSNPFSDRARDFVDNLLSQPRLLINTGPGNDVVDAEVNANVRVHVAGNISNDDISVQTVADSSENAESTDSAPSVDTGTSGNVDADLLSDANLNSSVDPLLDATTAADVSNLTGALTNVSGNMAADLASALALGRSTSTDLDSALTASLINNPALVSSSNIGPSALLSADQNLNGSIGGAAALNLVGDQAFDQFGLFNNIGLPNLSAADAATLATMTANSFHMNSNAVDDFFADFEAQNQAQLSSDLNADAAFISNAGFNDALGNGTLSSNINAAAAGAFQSRLGTVPLG